MDLIQMGKQARAASRVLAQTATTQKNQALERIAAALIDQQETIVAANQKDVELAQANGKNAAFIDRLLLTPARLAGMAADLRTMAELPDPVGEVFESGGLANGLRTRKVRAPLGVLGVIYESRPNVTIDVAGLAIKSGNAVILRGGSETIDSNRALAAAARGALRETGLPENVVQFVDDPDRARVLELLRLHEYVDMIIPRGAEALHRFCRENSMIPVITGGIGICHLFVDESANQAAAVPVIQNAKVQRPSVCNALDTILVHEAIAADFVPAVIERLAQDGVTFRLDPRARAVVGRRFAADLARDAGPEDFDTEWLSLVLGIRVVAGLDEAIQHIAEHSTAHSDGILTENADHARRFTTVVDSAAVYVNASTRFTDGSQLGLGGEVAISTQRLHARGPMGLRELTTYKWVIEGDYTVRK